MDPEIVIRKVREHVRTLYPTARIVLFGSRARGDFRKDSDWDFLILIPKEGKIRNEDQDMVTWPIEEWGIKNDLSIDAKLYSFSDWERRSITPFYKNIELEGIEL